MKKEIKARVSQEFFDRFDEAIHRKRASQQSAIVEALAVWMNAPELAQPDKPEPQYSKDQQKLIDQLFYYLETADPEEVKQLKSLLAAQVQIVKAKQVIYAKQGLKMQ